MIRQEGQTRLTFFEKWDKVVTLFVRKSGRYIYGQQTKHAVSQFQAAAKIKVGGIVGPETAGAIQNALEINQRNVILARGDKGAAVKRIQEQLVTLGYKSGGVDGVYGANTEKAVRQFQQKRKISADGKVGSVNRAELDKAIREKV